MSSNSLKLRTDLGVIDYVIIVDSIVMEYFGEKVQYQPHVGRLNAMRLFYNKCVLEDLYNLPHNIDDVMDMAKLVTDEEFLDAFKHEVEEADGYSFTFGNAYRDAMEIVNCQKSSLNRSIEAIKAYLDKFLEAINTNLSKENVEAVNNIINQWNAGKLNTETLVNAVGKSDAFNEIVGNDA